MNQDFERNLSYNLSSLKEKLPRNTKLLFRFLLERDEDWDYIDECYLLVSPRRGGPIYDVMDMLLIHVPGSPVPHSTRMEKVGEWLDKIGVDPRFSYYDFVVKTRGNDEVFFTPNKGYLSEPNAIGFNEIF